MIRVLVAGAYLMALAAAQQLPLAGITHVAFRVDDLERSRSFYQKLGFEQAFTFEDGGQITVAFIKINDHQFIELYPKTAADQALGLMHVCYEATDIQAVHDEYERRGLKPSEVRKARAGNLLFSLLDPEGQVVEFLQYLPGSLHVENRGKNLGPKRVGERLFRVTEQVRDAGAQKEFYKDRLSLGEEVQLASAGGTRLTFTVPKMTPGAAREFRDPGTAAITLIEEPAAKWTAVADRLIETPVESYPFNWGEGVQMMGLMRASRAAHNPRYADYVDRWARQFESEPIEKLLNIGSYVRPNSRPGYCGYWSPASAILYLYQDRRKPHHLKFAKQVADFIKTGAERSPEGALGHWQGSHQLWVDTVFMAAPLLAALGEVDDAATQSLVHAKHVQEPKSGLLYHMWDWQTGEHSEGYWGRGNGWVLMSIADTLEVMKRSNPKYRELVLLATSMAKGIASTQDSTGMWHTVLDDPSSYVETSASAMFTYGLLKLTRLGALPASYREPALRAWRAINADYVKDGVVVGVSAGTDPKGAGSYKTKAVSSQTWGTGAYLLAASETVR